MDRRLNPYAPGAGTPPPELAGRDKLLQDAAIALDRLRARRATRGMLLYGLRGVGKTVLLNKIQAEADLDKMVTVLVEAPEDRSLPGLLAPALRSALLKIDLGRNIAGSVRRALSGLAGFVRALKVKYGDVEIALDVEGERGVADSGDLEADLTDLFVLVGEAAADRNTAVVLFIDELQYIDPVQLGALLAALHRTSQRQLPVTVIAAGLPQLVGNVGRAKSYAERLFTFVSIDRLEPIAARAALCVPAEREGVAFEDAAIEQILSETQGYPYFLQEWGKHSWHTADASPIRREDAARATIAALSELDIGFFRVRFDRLTPAEKRYLRAMAAMGEGPHRSGDIAERLGQKVTTAAPVRSSLIAKGMLYSPSHGDTAFTVPLFDAFMKRTMP